MIEIVQAIDHSTKRLLQEIKRKDIITLRHSLYVGYITARFVEYLGLQDTYPHVYTGAILHDIGKIKIPDHILMKDSRLTDEEFMEIRNHAIYGAEILEQEGYPEEIIRMTKYHHEREDGRGYMCVPTKDICFEAKVLCIVDSYDAMCGVRPYRQRMSLQQAIDELKRCKGTQFDVDIAEKFIYFLANKFMC